MRTLFAVIMMLLSLSAAQGQSPIRIEESKIRVFLKNGSTCVSVPLTNLADRPIKAQLGLAWMSPKDIEAKTDSRDVTVRPGRSEIEVPFPLTDSSIWTRLYYSLAPNRADARSFAPANGIVSLSHIANHVFELKISTAGISDREGRLSVIGEAVHPLTRALLSGVEWNAKLKINGRELAPVGVVKSGQFAELVFNIPRNNIGDFHGSAEVEVVSRLGDFEQKASISDIKTYDIESWPIIQTDKPLYQPGQTIHWRAIIRGANGRPAQDAKFKLKISDEDKNIVHSARLVASRFGIVQDEWAIPGTAESGTYGIELEPEDQNAFQRITTGVRVSRYEPPMFMVTAIPDRTTYLTDETPRVAIAANYLSGKPVPKGHVKIIRVHEKWNPRTQKHESSDETIAEGNAGADGKFSAELDMESDQERLQVSDRNRFRDIELIAYYRDLTSGRAEQRRFDIRLTRDPIHIYIIPTEHVRLLPSPVYIFTYYADGMPASADVNIRLHGQTAKIHTNKYGVGRANFTDPDDDNGGADEGMEVTATDAKGTTGQWKFEQEWKGRWHEIKLFQLETIHAVHRAGEAVTIKITSPPDAPADQNVIVHAMSRDEKIASRVTRIVNHTGKVTFPYQPEFRGIVKFIAWSGIHQQHDFMSGFSNEKEVIFPASPDPKISAATERKTYNPGEKATLAIKTVSASGNPVEAALGVSVVVDKGALELARNGSQLDGLFGEPGGLIWKDLLAAASTSAVSPEMDLWAEARLASGYSFHSFKENEDGENVEDEPSYKTITLQMEKLEEAIDRHFAISFEIPQDVPALTRILGEQWTQWRDPWGMPYRVEFVASSQYCFINLWSAGSDKRKGTSDDFVAMTLQREYFQPVKLLITEAIRERDYPATDAEFVKILNEKGLRFESLRDPWGTPYRIKISTIYAERTIEIMSAGPDRLFETEDDFIIATFKGSYFIKERSQIEAALNNTAYSPQTFKEFVKRLDNIGFSLSQYRDPWGRPCLARSSIQSKYIIFAIHSVGPDGREDTSDDFDIAQFPVLLEEESARFEVSSQPFESLNGTGALSGSIRDQLGGIIQGATVMLITDAGRSYTVLTDFTGKFQFMSLPPGNYRLRVEMRNFKRFIIRSLSVEDGKRKIFDIVLEVEIPSQEVVVTESKAIWLSDDTAINFTIGTPLATSRVPGYFPETLLWIPELITDSKGSARVQIPAVDSAKTWKITVTASTQDGRIAMVQIDFRTFQSFFMDSNLPPVLTEGDKIKLPVTVRNLLDKSQKANVDFGQNEWSTVQGSPSR